MNTTTEQAAVAAQTFEQQLNALLLGARDSLPHGLNGRAFKAPPKTIATTRKMIRQGLCRPFKHLVDVCDEAIDAGAPLSEVNAALYRIIARNEVRALEAKAQKMERPVAVLTFRAAKEVNEYELAALRVANSPESVDAMEALIREAADVAPAVADVAKAVERSLVLSPRPVRRSMEITR